MRGARNYLPVRLLGLLMALALAGCLDDLGSGDPLGRPEDRQTLRDLTERYGWLRRMPIRITADHSVCFDLPFMRSLLKATDRLAEVDGISGARSIADDVSRLFSLRVLDRPAADDRLPEDDDVLAELLSNVSIASGISNSDCTEMTLFAYSSIPPGPLPEARYAAKHGRFPEPGFGIWESGHHLLEEPIATVSELLGPQIGVAPPQTGRGWALAVELDTGRPYGALTPSAVRMMIDVARQLGGDGTVIADTTTEATGEDADGEARVSLEGVPGDVVAFWAYGVAYTDPDGVVLPMATLALDGKLPTPKEWAQRLGRSWVGRDLVSQDYSAALMVVPASYTYDWSVWSPASIDKVREQLGELPTPAESKLRLVPVALLH